MGVEILMVAKRGGHWIRDGVSRLKTGAALAGVSKAPESRSVKAGQAGRWGPPLIWCPEGTGGCPKSGQREMVIIWTSGRDLEVVPGCTRQGISFWGFGRYFAQTGFWNSILRP